MASGGFNIHRSIKILDNAQIKGLHNTPITLVPAPGEGFFINPTQAVLVFNRTSDYVGVVAGNYVFIGTSEIILLDAARFSAEYEESSILPYFFGVASGDTVLTALKRTVFLNPLAYESNEIYDGRIPIMAAPASQLDNLPLIIRSTVELGPWTGGHVNNSLKVTTYYTIEEL